MGFFKHVYYEIFGTLRLERLTKGGRLIQIPLYSNP